MPTLSKPQLIERESPWRRESDRIQRELCRKGVPILAGLGYYAPTDARPRCGSTKANHRGFDLRCGGVRGIVGCRSHCDSEESLKKSFPVASRPTAA
jgi:hypothetical protein